MTRLSPKAHKWVRGGVDYGPLLAFVAVNFATHDLIKATGALVAASAVALTVGFAVERRIAWMPLVAGGAAMVFGGLTVLFHDETFVKMKPTVMNTLFGVALLGGLVLRKNPLKALLGQALHLPEAAWRTLTLRYGLFFLALAALNEAVWRTQPDDVWVLFRFPGLMILALVFSFTQAPLMMKHAKAAEGEAPPKG
ncbi:MAG: inner membrane-spanning protein YciB [Phenylobacterium sp.]|uniref:inner membrane-spanning protein YciB n=1 Tax=Phenylobacterium sp. TaxID=1871053 RepID=UPI00391878B1